MEKDKKGKEKKGKEGKLKAPKKADPMRSEETDETFNEFGGIPLRNLKKNLGCG